MMRLDNLEGLTWRA